MTYVATFRFGNVKYFEIELNRASGVYFAGQTVVGDVVFDLKKEAAIKSIRLKFEGKAYVQFEQNSFKYMKRETYLDDEVPLLLPGQGTATKLPAGRHILPFTFRLPRYLPSSFESGQCYIQYSIISDMGHSRTGRFFTVISVLDLNKDPRAILPNEGADEKNLCCCCCTSGPISATFRIERRGFVPGEAIQLYANITNRSNRRVDKSYVNLKQIIIYKVKGATSANNTEVARVTQGPIEQGQSFNWENQTLIVPPLLPTSIGVSGAIDVKYILQLNVDPAGPAFDLEIPLEIIIGNIPLSQSPPSSVVEEEVAGIQAGRTTTQIEETSGSQTN